MNLPCKSTPVADARKKYQYIIGCASVSGKCWITVFHEIYDFQCKSGEFFGNTGNFHIFLQNYRFPGPARPACARPYKTNAFPYIFVLFRVPGRNFHKSMIFCKTVKMLEITNSAWFLLFVCKSLILQNSGRRKNTNVSLGILMISLTNPSGIHYFLRNQQKS